MDKNQKIIWWTIAVLLAVSIAFDLGRKTFRRSLSAGAGGRDGYLVIIPATILPVPPAPAGAPPVMN